MTGPEVVECARGWIGTPYRHQASCRGAGADCLGLLRGVWREVYGQEPETVPAYTADWSEPQGEEALLMAAHRHLRPVAMSAAYRPGEVLLFRMRAGGVAKHIGILARAGSSPSFVHAYSGYSVIESPLSVPWERRIAERFTFPEGFAERGA